MENRKAGSRTDTKPMSLSKIKEARAPFHLMTKPIGAICNLDCKYCYYLEKGNLFPTNENFKMSDEVLDAYIRQYIEAQPVEQVTFSWQGGEPTLLGLDFFRKAVRLQKKYGEGRNIENTLQTNGTLLNDEWGVFLRENDFLVGVSIDGPRKLHDTYRVDKRQRPTFDRVMQGIELCQKHGVRINTLTVVHRHNAQKPYDVYRFLRSIGSRYMQFIPLVERLPASAAAKLGLSLATPPDLQSGASGEEEAEVIEWSVRPMDYGKFLTSIFDRWVRKDVGRYFVQMFDGALSKWMQMNGGLCIFEEQCGLVLALEHDGSVYSCDHYVYPDYRLGNLLESNLADIVDSPAQRQFGKDKSERLPDYCRRCEVRFACNGGCPKHRFRRTPEGEFGLNYLCPGYKHFFNHVDSCMRAMGQLCRQGQAPANIMQLVAEGRVTPGEHLPPGPQPV